MWPSCFQRFRRDLRPRWAGLLALVAAGSLLVPAAPVSAFDGASLRGSSFLVAFGTRDLLPRIQCPALTTSTGRPGDFSFCRGTISLYKGGTLVARGPFSIRTYDSHVERIPLTGAGRGFVTPRSTNTFDWVVVSHDGQGQARETRGSATFHYPHGR